MPTDVPANQNLVIALERVKVQRVVLFMSASAEARRKDPCRTMSWALARVFFSKAKVFFSPAVSFGQTSKIVASEDFRSNTRLFLARPKSRSSSLTTLASPVKVRFRCRLFARYRFM